jgi:transposase InsO family protein
MPWKESRAMDLRAEMIREYQEGESVAALAEFYGVSRKTFYKWWQRWEAAGVAGLADLSRAPHSHPHAVDAETAAKIVAARQHWKWGPRKLRIKLQQQDPERAWPAASTIAEILQQRGLSHSRRPRARTPPGAGPLGDVTAANQTWCADYKGWFRTQDGARCDPLTITDAHSRYLLRCQLTPTTSTAAVEAVFDAAFREFGLPLRIHTDNGTPFASRAPGGLSRLSLRWVKLGIVCERSRPGTPQDNGRHERLHLTLKQDTLMPPAANPRSQQQRFQRFQNIFNHERPHEALNNATPAQHYAPSPRPFPRRVPALAYGDAEMAVRRVDRSGHLRWSGRHLFVSEIFAGEPLGLRALDDRYLQLFFGPVSLGWVDQRLYRFRRQLPLRLRRQLAHTA